MELRINDSLGNRPVTEKNAKSYGVCVYRDGEALFTAGWQEVTGTSRKGTVCYRQAAPWEPGVFTLSAHGDVGKALCAQMGDISYYSTSATFDGILGAAAALLAQAEG